MIWFSCVRVVGKGWRETRLLRCCNGLSLALFPLQFAYFLHPSSAIFPSASPSANAMTLRRTGSTVILSPRLPSRWRSIGCETMTLSCYPCSIDACTCTLGRQRYALYLIISHLASWSQYFRSVVTGGGTKIGPVYPFLGFWKVNIIMAYLIRAALSETRDKRQVITINTQAHQLSVIYFPCA